MNAWTLAVRVTQVNGRLIQQMGDPLGTDMTLLEHATVVILDERGKVQPVERVGVTADNQVVIEATPSKHRLTISERMAYGLIGWGVGVVCVSLGYAVLAVAL